MFEAYINYLINYDWTTHFLYGLQYIVCGIVLLVAWELVFRPDLINYLIRKLEEKSKKLEDNE